MNPTSLKRIYNGAVYILTFHASLLKKLEDKLEKYPESFVPIWPFHKILKDELDNEINEDETLRALESICAKHNRQKLTINTAGYMKLDHIRPIKIEGN